MTDVQSRRRRSRWPIVGVSAGALVLAGAGIGAAEAATAAPALTFVAATKTVTAERYVGEDEVYLSFDLGLHVIAGKEAFEVRARRTGYDKPITAHRTVTKKGKKTQVALPAGTVKDFTGLTDFTTITIKNQAGKVVASYRTSFCGNSYSSARTRRDAPATNPYPTRCGGENPFTLGAVWGVQAGWNAAVADQPSKPGALDKLTAGKYTAEATVAPKYRKMFGIPDRNATAKVTVNVVDAKIDEEGLAAARTRDAREEPAMAQQVAAAGHDRHAEEGDAGRQVSSFRPEFRAAASRPATLKAAPKAGPKPDLKSLPAWGISLSQEGTKTYVNFGATVWNAGSSPLVVDGFRRTGTDLMDAYQYFFDAKGKQVGSRPAGTMEWDDRDGHKHWHFTDFAQYNLLKADQKFAVRSGKEAFCLANTDAVDYTVKDAKWRPDNTDLSTSCGANTVVAVREVLDIGNGDTYSQDRPGQSFDITGLPNGTYYIQVVANPAKRLSELSTANNTALRKIVLGGTPAKRTLSVPKVYGITG
ncbi:lysyl oxidase family protein [Actinoplanes sp. NPDC023801]|uniref:lysyl oxidase family protein n=1 Tax=Actinoplanes sp. NPDC023801 TaxID=3154595 RepID=UPI0033F4BF24